MNFLVWVVLLALDVLECRSHSIKEVRNESIFDESMNWFAIAWLVGSHFVATVERAAYVVDFEHCGFLST